MFFLGKWKGKKIASFTMDAGFAFMTKEELDAEGIDYSESEDIFDTVIEFLPDGRIRQYIQIPLEDIEEARSDGEEVDDTGLLFAEEYRWEEQDGEYVYILDDEVVPITLTDEGLLKFNLDMAHFEKL